MNGGDILHNFIVKLVIIIDNNISLMLMCYSLVIVAINLIICMPNIYSYFNNKINNFEILIFYGLFYIEQ